LLSYRHAFHAGNFADLLKHIVLVEILTYLVRKESPFVYIDTHAGAGLYQLEPMPPATAAPSHGKPREPEHLAGVSRLHRPDWPELTTYFDVLAACNSAPGLNYYPGSPLIAAHFLRAQDQSWLFELHPADAVLLRRHCAGKRQIRVLQRDGFGGLAALLPPRCRRGLMLIDPSYEIKSDYDRAVTTLAASHRKFATGIYALWYPVVDRQRIDRLEQKIAATGIGRIQRFELAVAADAPGRGMTAAGMIVVNPPWTLMATMANLLPRLASALARDTGAFSRCDQLAGET